MKTDIAGAEQLAEQYSVEELEEKCTFYERRARNANRMKVSMWVFLGGLLFSSIYLLEDHTRQLYVIPIMLSFVFLTLIGGAAQFCNKYSVEIVDTILLARHLKTRKNEKL